MRLLMDYPIELNKYYSHNSRGKVWVTPAGKRYKENLRWYVLQNKLPSFGKSLVSIKGLIFVPDKRRRDEDNIKKCLYDALVYAGLLDDDSQIYEAYFKKIVEPPKRLILNIEIFVDDGIRDF